MYRRAHFPGVIAAALSACALSACTLAPKYERPALPVPQAWPGDAPTAPTAATPGWREVFTDLRLQGLINLALQENRDLRVAVGNIQTARAKYGVQRAALLPTVDATGSETHSYTPKSVSQTGSGVDTDEFSATVGFTAYELDLFGRVRSLNHAALQSYLATEEDRLTSQISLIAEVAADDLALSADLDQLKLAQDTLHAREGSQTLIQRRFDAGAASQLDVRQAETLTEQARRDVASDTAEVGKARDALRLVVGADIPADLMPTGGLQSVAIRRDLPIGLPSEVLSQRPDVLSAEHALRAQNADIGAARAAFFPKITLTGSAGSASLELDRLFTPGSGSWSFMPQITLPIFAGGANLANLREAKAGRDIAVAQYEKAVQTAFRDVADALAVRATIQDQVSAEERLVAAASDSLRLSQVRYDRGLDDYLSLMDAQRTLYSAQQTLLNDRLAEADNRINLYKALGGGSR